jgi:F0F1-type ATP synthase delta subunit
MLKMELKMPMTIATKQDILRIQREVRDYDVLVVQNNVRKTATQSPIPLSAGLKDLVQLNQINLNEKNVPKKLIKQLEKTLKQVILFHMSFATEPSDDVNQKLIAWFRKEVDPKILLNIGIQPTISVGAVLRTNRTQYDFSLRKHLQNSQKDLVKALRGE